MSTAAWQPVLAALLASLLVLIPVATNYLKGLLEAQTRTIQGNIAEVKTQQSLNAGKIVDTVQSSHDQIVAAVDSIHNDPASSLPPGSTPA